MPAKNVIVSFSFFFFLLFRAYVRVAMSRNDKLMPIVLHVLLYLQFASHIIIIIIIYARTHTHTHAVAHRHSDTSHQHESEHINVSSIHFYSFLCWNAVNCAEIPFVCVCGCGERGLVRRFVDDECSLLDSGIVWRQADDERAAQSLVAICIRQTQMDWNELWQKWNCQPTFLSRLQKHVWYAATRSTVEHIHFVLTLEQMKNAFANSKQ